MQFVYRFFLGGLIVCVFAVMADILRPRGLAGLFGAAPSVALATLSLTLSYEGKSFAVIEARSMVAGPIAFLHAIICVYSMSVRHLRAGPTALGMLSVWGACAFSLWAMFLR
jgi:Protein of unknown function (DUF3147)